MKNKLLNILLILNIPVIALLLFCAYTDSNLLPFRIMVILLLYMFITFVILIIRLFISAVTLPRGTLKKRSLIYVGIFTFDLLTRSAMDLYIKHSTETFFENIWANLLHALVISLVITFSDLLFTINRKSNKASSNK